MKRWGKNVGRSHIRELISVRDTIMERKDNVFNYFKIDLPMLLQNLSTLS